MKQWHKGLIIGGAIIACCTCLLVVGTHSLWFLRGVVGSQPGVVELGYNDIDAIRSVSGSSATNWADGYVGFSAANFTRLVYVRDNTNEYIVAIPRFVKQLEAPRELRNAQWVPTRIGWIIVGKRPTSGSIKSSTGFNGERDYNALRAVLYELRVVFIQHGPINPIAYMRTMPGVVSLNDGISAYAEGSSASSAHIVVGFHSNVLPRSSSKQPKFLDNTSDLFIAIQSNVLSYYPKQLTVAMRQYINGYLKFLKTTPDVISEVPGNAAVSVSVRGENIALGVNERSDQFGLSVLRMLSLEQGSRHPQKKGFALPDGTIGYEYIPTKPVITFSSDADASGCKQAVGYDDMFFLCENNGVAVVSLHEDFARAMLGNNNEMQGVVRGYISSPAVHKIFPDAAFQSLTFSGGEDSVDIWLKLNDQ